MALLPLLNFVLLKFSRHVAMCIIKSGYEVRCGLLKASVLRDADQPGTPLQLQGKTDQRFIEVAFKLFRDCFNIKTVLTPGHFLDQVGTGLWVAHSCRAQDVPVADWSCMAMPCTGLRREEGAACV